MQELLATAVLWGEQHAYVAPLLYVLFVIIGTILFMPGSLAMMTSGFVFGFVPGAMIAALAIPLAGQSAFTIGRRLARSWVERKIADKPRLRAIESALQQRSFLIVALTRVSLLVPFNVLNYFYGATSVKSKTHFLATALGMLPAVVMYAYLGSVAKSLQQVLSGEVAPTQLGVWLAIVGSTVIIFVTAIIHRTASRALQKYMPDQ